jgi:hypothetical protein
LATPPLDPGLYIVEVTLKIRNFPVDHTRYQNVRCDFAECGVGASKWVSFSGSMEILQNGKVDPFTQNETTGGQSVPTRVDNSKGEYSTHKFHLKVKVINPNTVIAPIIGRWETCDAEVCLFKSESSLVVTLANE